jgi:hypothetical protein
MQVANNQRYQKIIRNEIEDIYGLGTKRNLEDWKNYSGIDFINDIASDDAYKGITPTL